MSTSLALERRVYQAFAPEPPTAASIDEIYVRLDEVRGNDSGPGITENLARRIRLSDPTRPGCHLLAGHRGCGKSTELLRLKRKLEDDKDFFTILVPAEEGLDFNDVDFPDILLFITRKLADEVREREGISLNPGYFATRLEWLKKTLTNEVELEGLDVELGLLSLSTKIKQSPTARDTIRRALEPETASLLKAANDLIGQAKAELKKRGWKDLAILVDDIDKIVMRSHATAGCTSGEYLFINREPQMSGFNCTVLYTIPLALAYSHRGQDIANLYGGEPPVMPMVKVRHRPPDHTPFELGYEKLREMAFLRTQQAGAIFEEVFSPEILDHLICLSGGQPREFMLLIRRALEVSSLPISSAGVDRAALVSRRAFERQLMEEHRVLIQQVAENGVLPRNTANDVLLRDLLDSRAVLQYINSDEWYAPNPLLPSFAAPAKVG